MDFTKVLSQHIKLTPELLEAITARAEIETAKKGMTLLQEGEMCRKLYFVEKGMLRFYYTNEEGKDITLWFVPELSFITEVDSFFAHRPSDYYIEALEDCSLFTLTLEKLNYLLDNYPQLERFGRIFGLQMAVAFGEKVKDLQFRSARERYDSLLQQHPDILQRAALGHIASYLGITQQSLSRIRSSKNYS